MGVYKSQAEIALVDKASGPWASMMSRMQASATKMQGRVSGSIRNVSTKFNRAIGRMLRSVTRLLPLLGAAGLVYGFVSSAKAAVQFSDQIAKVSTMLSGKGLQHLDTFSQELKNMSVEFGRSTQDLSDGLYNILSAGVPAGSALEHLNVVTKSAVGGFTELFGVTRAVSAMMTAYQSEGLDAARATDVLAAIVEKGITTLGELAPSIGMVTSFADSAGIKLNDLAGMLATVTKSGVGTFKSVTSLRSLLMALQKPTEDNAIYMERLQKALERGGAIEFARTLRDMVISGTKMTDIFSDARSQLAVGMLTKNIGFLKDSIDASANSAGMAQRKFEQMSKTPAYRMRQMREELTAIRREIGDAMMPALLDVVRILKDLFHEPWVLDAIRAIATTVSELLVGITKILAAAADGIGKLKEKWDSCSESIISGAIATDSALAKVVSAVGVLRDSFDALLGQGLQGKLFWVGVKESLLVNLEAMVGAVQKTVARIKVFWQVLLDTLSFDEAAYQADQAVQKIGERVRREIAAIQKEYGELRKTIIDTFHAEQQAKNLQQMAGQLRKIQDEQKNQQDARFKRGQAIRYKEREARIADRFAEIAQEEMYERIRQRISNAKLRRRARVPRGATPYRRDGKNVFGEAYIADDTLTLAEQHARGQTPSQIARRARLAQRAMAGRAEQLTMGMAGTSRMARFIRKFGPEEGMRQFRAKIKREQRIAPGVGFMRDTTPTQQRLERWQRMAQQKPLEYAKQATERIGALTEKMGQELAKGNFGNAEAIAKRIGQIEAAREKAAGPLQKRLETLKDMKRRLEEQGKEIPKELENAINNVEKALGKKVEDPIDMVKKHMTGETNRIIAAVEKNKAEATAAVSVNCQGDCSVEKHVSTAQNQPGVPRTYPEPVSSPTYGAPVPPVM